MSFGKGENFVVHLGFAFGGLLGSVQLEGLRRFLLPLFSVGVASLAPSVSCVGLRATPLVPCGKMVGWWGWWWPYAYTPPPLNKASGAKPRTFIHGGGWKNGSRHFGFLLPPRPSSLL